MEDFENVIEKYRQELMDFSKQNGAIQPEPVQAAAEPAVQAAAPAVSAMQTAAPEPDDAVPVQAKAPRGRREAPVPDPSGGIGSAAPGTGIEITAGVPVGSPNREQFATYEEFLKNNPQTGTLRMQVYATNQAFPIGNARVRVLLELADSAREMFVGLTDTDGIIASIPLPAPDVAMSQQPSESRYLPYSLYTTIIEHPNYVSAKYTNVPIFSGIESIQGVELVPLVSGGDAPSVGDIYGDEQFTRLEGEM